MHDWINSIPNDGLIQYRSILNTNRLMVTTPKALSEVLNQKCYEYTKPRFFTTTLTRLLGEGLFLAEGVEHKVRLCSKDFL